MAFYPVAPDWKVQYHEDNSAGFVQSTSGGAVTVISTGTLAQMNSETTGPTQPCDGSSRCGIIFPCLMDVIGICISTNGGDNPNGVLKTSTDTTSGGDGTWTTISTTFQIYGALTVPRWRTDVQAVTLNGIRALSVVPTGSSGSIRWFNIYGRPTVGEAPDRLIFWDPTLSQMLSPATFDFGDQPRATTTTRTFRIKNNSPTLTANGIVLSAAAASAASPTLASQTTFSPDGTTFTASPNIGNLAPGTVSGTLHARLALTNTAQLAPWRQRIKASATTWT